MFVEFLSYHNLLIADTTKDAIYYLNRNIFDVIYLDDRLRKGDGFSVAKFIKQLPYKPTVIVHSFNILAFEKIRKLLPWAIHKPYNSEEFYLLEQV